MPNRYIMLLFNLFSVNNRNNYPGFFTVVFWSLVLQNNEYAPRWNCALPKLLSFGAIQKSLKVYHRLYFGSFRWQRIVILVVLIIAVRVITKAIFFQQLNILNSHCSKGFTCINTVITITFTILFHSSFFTHKENEA